MIQFTGEESEEEILIEIRKLSSHNLLKLMKKYNYTFDENESVSWNERTLAEHIIASRERE